MQRGGAKRIVQSARARRSSDRERSASRVWLGLRFRARISRVRAAYGSGGCVASSNRIAYHVVDVMLA